MINFYDYAEVKFDTGEVGFLIFLYIFFLKKEKRQQSKKSKKHFFKVKVQCPEKLQVILYYYKYCPGEKEEESSRQRGNKQVKKET